MPISQAAMDGISRNGLGWRMSMNGRFKANAEALGAMNDRASEGEIVTDEEVEVEVKQIIAKSRKWAESLQDRKIAEDLLSDLDRLEEVEDCGLDEVNYAMDRFYDCLDYWRILT